MPKRKPHHASKPVSARKPSMASQADRHKLYEGAVQCVEAEIDFVDETFSQLRGRKPKSLREDFCGTAGSACEFVRRRKSNTAIGVDLDGEVLDWGRRHNVAALNAHQQLRVSLLEQNVMQTGVQPVDVTLAMNFSYWIFKQRSLLKRYFKRVHKGLADDGVFFLDCFGGYDAFRELREKRECDGYIYTWHQAEYNPINGDYVCHIDFKFPDGSRMKQAFTYEWRLWTLPEIQELLTEAGFADVTVYWEGTDEETLEGNGEYAPAEVGDADAGWIAYIVAAK